MKFKWFVGLLTNLLIIACILIVITYFGFKLYYLRILVFLHTIMLLIYLRSIGGRYTPYRLYRSSNIVEILFNYFILNDYNTLYENVYKVLSGHRLGKIILLKMCGVIIYRLILVWVIGLPYKIIIFCKNLITPIFQIKADPYALFVCNINIVIVPNTMYMSKCIYFLKNRRIYTNGIFTQFFIDKFKNFSSHNFHIKTIGPGGSLVRHRSTYYDGYCFIRTTKSHTFGVRNIPTGVYTYDNKQIYVNINIIEGGIKNTNPYPEKLDKYTIHMMHVELLRQCKGVGYLNILVHDINGSKINKIKYELFIQQNKGGYIELLDSIACGDGVDIYEHE